MTDQKQQMLNTFNDLGLTTQARIDAWIAGILAQRAEDDVDLEDDHVQP